jgi:hypothetical protein
MISATVAQLLANNAPPHSLPWYAPSAFFISLGVMAVITASHQTIFLNSVSFHVSADDRLGCILDIRSSDSVERKELWSRKLWLGTFMYSLPQLLLTYSIFALFIGLGLTHAEALWSRGPNGVWEAPEKASMTL